ncbi:MAG: hypothetical protein L0Y60_10935 [Beijerinckiaceae bacterium]|nr:hypothetical protein [Beijerinckiaceae bacterium]
MMLHQDASPHASLLRSCAPLDLVATMDDAGNAISSAILAEEEGTMSSLLRLSQTIERRGCFVRSPSIVKYWT